MNQDIREPDGTRRGFGDDALAGQGFAGGAGVERPPATDTAEGLGSLIAGVVKDLQDVLRGEIQLAKTEVKDELTTAGRGIGFIAAGALLGLVGFIFLMLGVTYILNQWLEMWLAAGIVGLVLAALAAGLAISGRRQMSAASLKPEQTIESLKEDQAWAKQQINSVKR